MVLRINNFVTIKKVEIPFGDSFINGRWFIPQGNSFPAVIKYHGLPGNPLEEEDQGLGKFLLEKGIAYLAFNFTGVRESPGIYNYYNTLGNAEIVIDWVLNQPGVNPFALGVYGESFGGAIATVIAARDKRVRALALRVPVFNTEFISQLAGFKKIAEIMEDTGSIRYPKGELKKMYQEQTKEHNPWNYVDKISPRPLLIVGSSRDTIIPPDGVFALYERAKQPKEFYEVKGGDHNLSNTTHREEAFTVISEFFSRVLEKEL